MLRGEISALAENVWEERRTDELMEGLSARKHDPYTLSGEILQKILK